MADVSRRWWTPGRERTVAVLQQRRGLPGRDDLFHHLLRQRDLGRLPGGCDPACGLGAPDPPEPARRSCSPAASPSRMGWSSRPTARLYSSPSRSPIGSAVLAHGYTSEGTWSDFVTGLPGFPDNISLSGSDCFPGRPARATDARSPRLLLPRAPALRSLVLMLPQAVHPGLRASFGCRPTTSTDGWSIMSDEAHRHLSFG